MINVDNINIFYYRVLNVQSVFLSSADVHFKSSHDHSKWAVSVDGKKKATWVCVGDINRAVSLILLICNTLQYFLFNDKSVSSGNTI